MDTIDSEKIKQIKACAGADAAIAHIFEGGEDFLVIEIDSGLMFRFARNAYALRALGCEKRFLPTFSEQSPLPVPRIRFSGDDFIAYPKVRGQELSVELYSTLDRSTQKRIAAQFGKFLTSLHQTPIDSAATIGLEESWGGWRRRAFSRFVDQAAPRLSPRARINVLAFVEQFFAMEYKRVIIHGDFYPPDHVFFDPEEERLSGVIDFGDLTIEDAATDFQSILRDFGDQCLESTLEHYSGEIDNQFLDRLQLRIKAYPIFDAIYALDYGFEDRFNDGLKEIEAAFG